MELEMIKKSSVLLLLFLTLFAFSHLQAGNRAKCDQLAQNYQRRINTAKTAALKKKLYQEFEKRARSMGCLNQKNPEKVNDFLYLSALSEWHIYNERNINWHEIAIRGAGINFDYYSGDGYLLFGKALGCWAPYKGYMGELGFGYALSDSAPDDTQPYTLNFFSLDFGVRKFQNDINENDFGTTYKGHFRDLLFFFGPSLNGSITDYFSLFLGNYKLYLYVLFGIKDRAEKKLNSSGVEIDSYEEKDSFWGVSLGARGLMLEFTMGSRGGFHAGFSFYLGYTSAW